MREVEQRDAQKLIPVCRRHSTTHDVSKFWADGSGRAPNVHKQMCTTGRPFQPLGCFVSNHPDQKQKQLIIKQESALPKSVCNFFALSEMQQSAGNARRMPFFVDRFRNCEDSLGTSIEHIQSRCMEGGAQKPSFPAILCSSACARLLVHVRCSQRVRVSHLL